jgi:hypothetical protein
VDCCIEEWRRGIDMRARVQLRAKDRAIADARLDWGYEGERKEFDITLDDGQVVHVDMLAGFSAFKSSLDHEYVGILTVRRYGEAFKNVMTPFANNCNLAESACRRLDVRFEADDRQFATLSST